VDAYRFPSSVRQRFVQEHHALGADDIATVEAATRQWFRLAARHRKAKLSMPSVIVDDYWHEMVLHTREYAEFCDAALGRFLHHVPESTMSAADAVANRTANLRDTLKLAQADEGLQADQLPLLFRVDRDLDIQGGRRYLADCGGRGQCYGMTGSVCLQHVDGAGRGPRSGRWEKPPTPLPDPPIANIGGCGGA
jgi:hypothetical protein